MNYKVGAGNRFVNDDKIDDPNGQIAVKLRALYQAVQEEVIPDRFLDLLEKLDAVERQAASAKSSADVAE